MSGRVLVVDDDDALRESLCELLEEEGFDAAQAQDGAGALAWLRSQSEKPDVIVLDLMMPGMNGWQFREAQRRDPALADIPVVVMTARRDVDDIEADEIVRKPVKLEALLGLLRRHVGVASRPLARHGSTDDPPSPERAAIAAVFAGGGELGGRMAAIDWSQTPLGPVHTWPQSLRTCVRIILTSRQPMFVWWGERLINLYNDAYKSIIGGKHPEALGQPASEVWREIWRDVEPRAESAMRSNEGTYDEALLLIMERHGYQEETYYTFSYSPVPNDQGGTGGIICANTDDTRRIIGERQLALLRELAGRSVEGRTLEDVCAMSAGALATDDRDLPFALLYVAAPDRRGFRLEAATGLEPGSPAAPTLIAADDGSTWPLGEALRQQASCLVEDLEGRFGPLPTGAWPRAPHRAAIVPVAASGDTGRPGALVVGLNPFRLFDDAYRSFLELVAGQIASSIANAQAYEEERKRAEALAEIDRAKTAFFSNVSHEFRTPLTLMLGPSHDLLAGLHGDLDPAQREPLEVLHRNGLRLQRLVNALLDFSRLEAGRVRASFVPTDLPAVTRELASAFQSAVDRAGLRLIVDCPPLADPAFVDRDMWEKIVLNLISNALKFTFEGRIEVSLRPDDDGITLRVADTGVGIAPDDLPRVFERFHRIEGVRARTHEGSGIGLALVQELARLHGGEVRVDSALGRGTTFTVTIPKGAAHLPRERLGAAPSATAGAAPFVEEALRWLPGAAAPEPVASVPSDAPRILLADDNADMRDYVRRHLARHWRVDAVEDGRRALAAALADPPDLVLTDVMMPGLDGFELLRHLRADPRTRGIPVIMLSARSGEEARVEGLQAGAEDYLSKPFSARELVARVRTHLELARLRDEIRAQEQDLYALFAQAPVPIAVLRGERLVFEMANKLYSQVSGGRDVVGQPLLEALPELRGQGYDDLLLDVMRSGRAFVGEAQHLGLDRDGDGVPEDTWWTFTYAPLRNVAGEVDRVMAFCHEVTDQVVARRAIEQSEERFRRLVTHVQAGIAQLDLAGRFTLVNERFRELTGRSDAELRQLTVRDITHPDDMARDEAGIARVVAEGAPFVIEKRYVKPDGSIVWVQNTVSRLDDPAGRPQGIAKVTVDITQRKFAEEALAASEAKFRQIFEGVEVSLWQQDFTAVEGRVDALAGAHGQGLRAWLEAHPEAIEDAVALVRVTDANPATLRLLGASDKGELAAALPRIFVPETHRVFGEALLAIAERRRVVSADTVVQTLRGERLPVAVTIVFPAGDDGWDRVVVTMTDISTQKLVEQEREARFAEMERAVRFSEMFVGILGHDLRNPLSAITMAAGLLQARAESDRAAKTAGRIAGSALRMERMIAQLLDFTRIRLGRGLPLDRRRVDLAELARAIVDELEPVQQREIRLESDGDVAGTWDRDRLSQLVSNLAANACQHGTADAPVRIRLDGRRAEAVELEVSNGGAIPPELLPVVFEPLRHSGEGGVARADGSSGLGLGLYITQQIALAHGGAIRVESDEARGTRFVVELPRQPPSQAERVFGSGGGILPAG